MHMDEISDPERVALARNRSRCRSVRFAQEQRSDLAPKASFPRGVSANAMPILHRRGVRARESGDCATMSTHCQFLAVDLEAVMASKDKGGRAAKKVGKNLKEKRVDKKTKRAESDAKHARAT